MLAYPCNESIPMATIQGSSGHDIINGAVAAGPYDWIDALEGDDQVTLTEWQIFVSGPGNDSVTGTQGRGGYGLWYATSRPTVDLSQGYALDGFGGRDTLSGIDTVHMSSLGGTMIGSAAAETLFIFGGNNTVDMGAGNDTVRYHEKQSADYTLNLVNGVVEVKNLKTGTLDTIKGVETFLFADKSVSSAYLAAPLRANFQYQAYSFVETTIAPPYTYAGVSSPGGLLPWFPQGPFQLDVNGDGRKDVIIPMNKGYATGLDTRTPFIALTTANGRLEFNGAINAQMPATSGVRRAADIELADGHSAILTIAHDGHDGKLADLQLMRGQAGNLNANGLVPTLPLALPGRPQAVNAHSMAVGDLNGDGLQDALVGDWNAQGAYALLQGKDGRFTLERQALFTAITNQWPMVNPNAGEKFNILVDLAIVDVNGDGYGDIVAGWGHGSTPSYVFLNRQGKFSVDDKIALPLSIYGIDNQQHMKTLVADFDRDGDLDMAVLRLRFDPYYGGQYLQLLNNDGKGNFTDITAAAIDKPFQDAYGARLEWSDHWQVMDVNGDGALDIVGHRTVGSNVPLIYANDGTGRFTVHEVVADSAAGLPLQWGDFDGDGKIEYVAFATGWNDAAGTSSTQRFSVVELAARLGTGPDLQHAATLGAPAYNEGYYLKQYSDVAALVASGKYASGLMHYLAIGKAEGRQAIAAGTHVEGGNGADIIVLREGNESATGGAGNDSIDGAAGLDIAYYAGVRARYTVQRTGTGYTVKDNEGSDGTDILANVERLVFGDGALAIDIMGNAGIAYRIYQAAFARTPDVAGLSYWIAAMDKGYAFKAVAEGFVISAEFKALYGASPTHRNIVEQIYENVLRRPGEEAGITFWTGVLDSHAASVAEVLMGFSESAENQAALIGVIGNGIPYIPG